MTKDGGRRLIGVVAEKKKEPLWEDEERESLHQWQNYLSLPPLVAEADPLRIDAICSQTPHFFALQSDSFF